MSISRNVELRAAEKALTLAELRQFVADLDSAGAADDTVIKGRVNFGGTIKSMSASAVRVEDSRAPAGEQQAGERYEGWYRKPEGDDPGLAFTRK